MDALTPRRRAVGIGDEPNNAGAGDALGENWRSALCVTSLYDSYVAVQHENDALKEQLRQVQHANELLLAGSATAKKKKSWARRPEAARVGVVGKPHDDDETNDDGETNENDEDDAYRHLAQEIRLLRAEKAQQELLFDKRRAQLEALADQYKAQHAELQAKYQQKFELDPLEPQRVALSTRALQQALDQCVHEKEELVVAHTRLQQLLQRAEAETRALRDQHEQLTRDRHARASRSVRAVLDKWTLARVGRAWQQWRLVALSERLCAQQAAQARQQRETQQQERRQTAQARAKAFGAKMLQTTTQRTWAAWQQFVAERKRQRARLETMRRSRLRRVWRAWQKRVRGGQRVVDGATRLETLLARHATRRAWHKWQTHATQTQVARQQRVVDALQAHVATLEATVQELLQTVATARTEREQLTARAHQQVLDQDVRLEALTASHQRTRERVSELLFQRRQRLALRDTMRAWRQTAVARRLRHHRTAVFVQARAARALQKSVAHWHGVAHAQRRFQLVAGRAVQRMRLLGAYRCFAAWRAVTSERKARVATLARVVRHLTSQHVVRSFKSWQQFRADRIQHRQCLAALCAIVARVQLAGAVAAWRKAAAALGRQAEQHKRQEMERAWRERLEQSKRELQVLRGAFQAWQRTTRSGKRFRQLTRACAVQWKRGSLGRCVDAWRDFVARRRGVRDVLRRLEAKRTTGELQTAWTRWRTHTVVRAKDAELLEIERERDARVTQLEAELLALQLAAAAARATSAEREQQLTMALEATQGELAMARGAHAQYKTAFKSVCLTLQQKRTRLACLRAWQEAWQHARRREKLVTLALERQEKQVARRILRCWHLLARRRKRMLVTTAKLQHVWQSQVLQDCLRALRVYAAHERRVSHAKQTFAHRARHRLCHGVLNTWREDARKARLLRKTLEQIWLSSVHAHMLECFTSWRERTIQLRLHDELQRRQSAMDAIRTRVCARWTTRSLTHVLAAWRQGVENQKRSRAGVKRLRRLHDQRLFEIAFSAWQCHHAQLQRQREWLQAWLARQEHHAVASSWREWKEQMIERRKEAMRTLESTCQEQAVALATKDEQIVAMEDHRERLRSQVETLERARGDAGETAARLAKAVTLTKCLYHWRALCRFTQSRKMQLERLIQRHDKRHQQRVLREWATQVNAKREKRRVAHEMAKATSHRRLRGILSAWRLLTQRERATKHVVRRLHRRRARQTQFATFAEWRAFARRCHVARRVLAVMDNVVHKLTRRGAFAAWQHATRSHKAQVAAQDEKQRRVLAFLMDKQSYALAKYFNAWRSLGAARHGRLAAVQKMARRTQSRRLRELWMAWRASLTWQSQCARSVAVLLGLVRRQRLRSTFHHWRTQDTRDRIASLSNSREQLVLDRQVLQQELQASQEDAMQLRQSLMALQQSHTELSDAARGTLAATESACSARMREATRQVVLQRLLTRVVCVPVAAVNVGVAFQRWRRHATRRGQQLAALRRCEHLISRKQQARSFSRWRRRAAACGRLAARRLWRAAQLRRVVFSAWTQFVRDCALRRRRFLVRWIETTHTLQVQTALEKKTAMAFRVWQLHAANARAQQRASELATTSDAQRAERLTQQRKRALLTKWCWRAYHTRCQDLRVGLTRWHSLVQRWKLEGLRMQLDKVEAEQSESKATRASGSALTETVVQRVAQSLQPLFRRLSAAQSCSELFDAVASSLAQLSFGSASAVLYLLDPANNELWTQRRDSTQVVQAPASLGIAGCALASLSTLLVEHAVTDSRFHPLMDQLAVSGVVTPLGGAGVDLFTTAIVGADGAAYGVLQIAFQADEQNRQATQTHLRLLGHACAFFVEQIVYEMVRHSRDRLRARSPQSFAKLFKQTKNWRKYFVQVEKEAQKTQQHLEQLLAEQDVLLDEKKRMLDALAQFEREQREVTEQREANKQQSDNHELLMKHLLTYKKKTAKIKELAQEKDRLLREKSLELERAMSEHNAYRQQVQAREWQQALTKAASPKTKQKRSVSGAPVSDDDDRSERDRVGPTSAATTHVRKHGVLLEGADVAALQNQLVRAESDSMLLVKAVDVATRHHGDLPETLKMEVNRIALRLKKPRD